MTKIFMTHELDYCPKLRDMLKLGKVRLRTGEDINIAGTSTLNNLRALRHRILTDRPTKTLEVGLAYGASALGILASLKESSADHHHTAIDPFQTSSWHDAAIDVISAAGLASNFRHLAEYSALALPRMCTEGESFGLIYVDGSHLFEDVFIDFYYSAQLLELGGTLHFDDCSDKHVKKVIKFIDSNYSGILKPIEPIPDEVKSTRRRVAHALGMRQLRSYQKIGVQPRQWNAAFRPF